MPEERALIDEYLSDGWVDTFRALHPDEPDWYTWWSNRAGVRERNVGWRIDYWFVTPTLLPRLESAAILREVLGSDHCPVELVLRP